MTAMPGSRARNEGVTHELVYWLVPAVFMVLLVICIVEYVNPPW